MDTHQCVSIQNLLYVRVFIKCLCLLKRIYLIMILICFLEVQGFECCFEFGSINTLLLLGSIQFNVTWDENDAVSFLNVIFAKHLKAEEFQNIDKYFYCDILDYVYLECGIIRNESFLSAGKRKLGMFFNLKVYGSVLSLIFINFNVSKSFEVLF